MSVASLAIQSWTVRLFDEPNYRPGSADNLRRVSTEHFFGDPQFRPFSKHRLVVEDAGQELASAVLMAGGGGTGVHEHSLAAESTIAEPRCFVVVGDHLAAFEIPSLELAWSLMADDAACFGVHFHPPTGSVLVHGELGIRRVNLSGEVLWQFFGRDIFTGSFELTASHVRVTDFNNERYSIDIASGEGSLDSF